MFGMLCRKWAEQIQEMSENVSAMTTQERVVQKVWKPQIGPVVTFRCKLLEGSANIKKDQKRVWVGFQPEFFFSRILLEVFGWKRQPKPKLFIVKSCIWLGILHIKCSQLSKLWNQFCWKWWQDYETNAILIFCFQSTSMKEDHHNADISYASDVKTLRYPQPDNMAFIHITPTFFCGWSRVTWRSIKFIHIIFYAVQYIFP